MKKLLISLSVLVVLLLSGCVTTSPTYKVVRGDYSITQLKEACDLDDARSCTALGLIYRDGEDVIMYRNAAKGVKKDFSKAKKYFSKACDLNYGVGCYSLARLYTTGEGVKKDYSKAKKYYKKSCDMNSVVACEQYKKLKKEGH